MALTGRVQIGILAARDGEREVTAPGLPRGYEAVGVLGSGGYGEVVLARQTSLDRLVAVKRIHAYLLTGADEQERFRREARVLAALDDATVVRVHDFISDGSAAFLVMEHVPGRTLADLLQDGPLPPAQALPVLRDVAHALRRAHERGVVHRDVKPGNVFVLPDGRAKLGDFGLARVAADPAVFRTSDGTVSGTPAYFPPESGLDEPDERSDAYSFGAMAFEVLTGRLPFDGDDPVQLLAAHLHTPAPRADAVVPGFPAAAAATLERALAKDPAARLLPWELVERLESIPPEQWRSGVAGGPRTGTAPDTVRTPPLDVQRRPEAPMPRLPRRRRRSGLVLPVAAVAVAAVAGVVVRETRSSGTPAAEGIRVESVDVAVAPADGLGRCPAARYEFTATVATNGGEGPVQVQWTRPDGRTTEPTVLDVRAGQRRATAVLAFDVTGELPLEGSAALTVLEPQQISTSSPPISYDC